MRRTVGAVEVMGAPNDVEDANGVEARVVAFIDAARRTLHGALYELSLPSVALALRLAAMRGVDVRLFLETDNRSSARERDCLALLDGAAHLRFDGRRSLMHDKFLVADGAAVWTGSINLTWTGCYMHLNEALLISDNRLAQRYESQFRRLFDEQPDLPTGPPLNLDGAQVNVAFARGAARLEPWLQATRQARYRIRLAAFSLTHPLLVEALARRAREGIEVEVVLDARLARGPAGRRALAALRAAGCRVWWGGPRPPLDMLLRYGLPRGQDIKIHHKLLVADDARVVTGSANLSLNGFEHNDENVLWFDGSPTLGALYDALWERARAASVPVQTDNGEEAPDDEVQN